MRVRTPMGTVSAGHTVVANPAAVLSTAAAISRAPAQPLVRAGSAYRRRAAAGDVRLGRQPGPLGAAARHRPAGGGAGGRRPIKPGHDRRGSAHWDDIAAVGSRPFGPVRWTPRWSAQDYLSADGGPLCGASASGHERVLVATGFGKWGLSTGRRPRGCWPTASRGRQSVGAGVRRGPTEAGYQHPMVAGEVADIAGRFVGDRVAALRVRRSGEPSPRARRRSCGWTATTSRRTATTPAEPAPGERDLHPSGVAWWRGIRRSERGTARASDRASGPDGLDHRWGRLRPTWRDASGMTRRRGRQRPPPSEARRTKTTPPRQERLPPAEPWTGRTGRSHRPAQAATARVAVPADASAPRLGRMASSPPERETGRRPSGPAHQIAL